MVAHVYAVNVWSDKDMPANKALLMPACMAAGEQVEEKLAGYRELIRARTGRDIPLAITEYNAGIYHYKPPLYRFSLGAALFSADLVRVLLQPDSHVLMANYWHFVNDSFGMVRGPRVPSGQPADWKKMPAYYAYRLWGRHFGTRLVRSRFQGPVVEFEGLKNVRPARKPLPQSAVALSIRGGSAKGLRWHTTGERCITAALEGFVGTDYSVIAEVRLPAGRRCCLEFEARTERCDAAWHLAGPEPDRLPRVERHPFGRLGQRPGKSRFMEDVSRGVANPTRLLGGYVRLEPSQPEGSLYRHDRDPQSAALAAERVRPLPGYDGMCQSVCRREDALPDRVQQASR